MAEEAETAAESGSSETAIAIALAGASRAEADAYLRDQRHHLHEQLRQLGLKLWELRLGVLLRIATAFIGIAVAAALAWLVWNAANSNDLVIDSFQVPPDLAVRGLSGPVIAAKLSDRIAAIQTQTTSTRPPRSYAHNLGEGLKLDIPETGVSLSELDRFLRQKLGHDLHIGGEMVQTVKGIVLTARAGADSATVIGAEAEMDTLLQKLAEQVYRTTQPYRYATWLNIQGRNEEAVAILKPLAAAGPPRERGWAYIGLANGTVQRQSLRAGLALYRRGQALDPDNFLLAADAGAVETGLGREEEGARDYQAAQTLLATHGRDYAQPDRIASGDHAYRSLILKHRGALLEAYQERLAAVAITTAAGIAAQAFAARAEMLALLHETATARTVFAERLPPANGSIAPGVSGLIIALAEQDWPMVLAPDKDFEEFIKASPGQAEYRLTAADPLVAPALAHMGRFAEAEARLRPMPGDCYPCLIARGQVAALQGQHARADWWFARAAAAAPTAPYAESEWGQSLLDRKQPDAAIAHFTAANRIGPHFADPLEGWGEALMAKNQSHLALAKFAEGEKYAPNWGRLHLRWGEALTYAGKPADARAQFARAAALDLTPSEKSELNAITLGAPHG